MLTAPAKLDRPEPRPALPNPSPIQTAPVQWVVVTPENLPEGSEWVFFALTPKDYENLSRNQADTLRWVTEAHWRLRYYRGEIQEKEVPK